MDIGAHDAACPMHGRGNLCGKLSAAPLRRVIQASRCTRNVFLVTLVLALVLAWATFVTAGASRVDIPLSDGGTLPAFLFTRSDHPLGVRPGVVVASNAGGVKLLQLTTSIAANLQKEASSFF